MHGYHLGCGGSTRGPGGMCGVVFAANTKQALILFRCALEYAAGAFGGVLIQTGQLRTESINVCVTARNIRIKETIVEGT